MVSYGVLGFSLKVKSFQKTKLSELFFASQTQYMQNKSVKNLYGDQELVANHSM